MAHRLAWLVALASMTTLVSATEQLPTWERDANSPPIEIPIIDQIAPDNVTEFASEFLWRLSEGQGFNHTRETAQAVLDEFALPEDVCFEWRGGVEYMPILANLGSEAEVIVPLRFNAGVNPAPWFEIDVVGPGPDASPDEPLGYWHFFFLLNGSIEDCDSEG